MTDLKPNPLVTALAERLEPMGVTQAVVQAYQTAEQAARLAEQTASVPGATSAEQKKAVKDRRAANASAQTLADFLAADPTVPPLVTFAGFLGGSLTDSKGTVWRLFYLDPKLLTWLFIGENDIVLRRAFKDERSPFGQRDVIWLRSSASVTEGTGPPRLNELEAQFLRGDFIGAGDFSASLTGGTFSRATGLLCEVETPGCCGKRTH